MKFLSFIFILFMAMRISAQELKTITINDELSKTREEISVLASDKKIKHGVYKLYKYDKLQLEGKYTYNLKDGRWFEYNYNGKDIIKESNYKNDTLQGLYIEYFSNKKIEKKGNYLNGLKQGLWEYYDDDHDLFERGSYKNGKEIGEWEFYYNGDLIQRYNFDDRKLVENNDHSLQENVIIYDDLKNPIDTIDVMPMYLGGIGHLYHFIANEIEYPRIARDNGIEGTVFVQLTIDESGNVKSAEMYRGIGGGCDEESVRVLKLTSGKWIPAYDDGKPIEMKYTQPIKFTLSE